MKHSRGFAFLPALLILIALAAIGGGAYYTVSHQKNQNSITDDTAHNASADSSREATPLDIPYACYAKTTTAIYRQDDIPPVHTFTLSSSAHKIEGADVATFREVAPYGICFGADAHHVYKDTTVLSWADPTTFKLLWYTKPGPVLFFRSGAKIIKYNPKTDTFSDVDGGDPISFETLLGGYDFAPWAKDKNQVYCNGVAVPQSDPKTATLVNQGQKLSVKVGGITQVYDGACHTAGGESSASGGTVDLKTVQFKPLSGTQFTIQVGQSATDGPDGLTLHLSSISAGVVSVSVYSKRNSTPYLVTGAVGGILTATGKSMVTAEDQQFPSGGVNIKIISVNGDTAVLEAVDSNVTFSG